MRALNAAAPNGTGDAVGSSSLDWTSAHPILIVDDEEFNRDALSRRLRKHGYNVDVAASGREALGLISERQFSLVLLDVMMPEMDGFQVLARLRTRHSMDELPIIMVTASGRQEDVVAALDAGASDYVVKPVDFPILKARMGTQLMRRKAQAIIKRTNEYLEDQIATRTAALRESQEKYQALYHDHPSILWTVDSEYRLVSVNDFGCRYVGLEPEEMVGRSVTTLLADSGATSALSQLNRCFGSPGTLFRWEGSILRGGDGPMPVRISARAIDSEPGRPTVLMVCEDISELHRLTSQLSYEMTHDSVTGLLNRYGFEMLIDNVRSGGDCELEAHALVMVSIDQFDLVGKAMGHVVANELLQRVGKLLDGSIAGVTCLAHLDPNRFAALLECERDDSVSGAARELVSLIDRFGFEWGGEEVRITASIGVRKISDGSMQTGELINDLQSACHVARESGGNRFHLYDASTDPVSRYRSDLEWVVRAKQAMETDRFTLFRQRILDLSPERSDGDHFEVLVRMLDDDGGIISPGSFLPAIEAHNLSTRFDRWIVEKAINWLTSDQRRVEALSVCSLNLSGASIGEPDLLQFLLETLRSPLLPPEKLCFEITETAAVADLSAATRFIGELRELGCRFALDDFGSGLSSFAYLRNLQVDYVKIDGMFVQNITRDRVNRETVKSINDIAHAMGKLTIAEFVDSEETLELLRELGVDYAQGFLIEKPRPLEIGTACRGAEYVG